MEDLTSHQALDVARIVSQDNAALISRLTLENAELRVRLSAALASSQDEPAPENEG